MIPMLDVKSIKKDFPILQKLTYLDSAATTLKPKPVVDAVADYYTNYSANVHRGIYKISEQATEKYEKTREKVADFIDAETEEVVFTKNATEAINLAAHSLVNDLSKGDEIVLTQMEHHANLVPWQQFAKNKGIKIHFIEIDDNGNLLMEQFKKKITNKTKIIATTHVSNVLGTINNIQEIAKIAHENNALYLVDAAQSVPHTDISFKKIDADFLAFSGHKMLGPTGIGCLIGKQELLEKLNPLNFGGDMIKEVTFEKTSFNSIPWKFESGTPHVAGVIGLGAAIDYLHKLGIDAIQRHEQVLTEHAIEKLKEANITIYGPEERAGLISFNVDKIHPHDLATVLDQENIAIRAGHHCAMPLMDVLRVGATARASFYVYNTKEDIDKLIMSIEKARTARG